MCLIEPLSNSRGAAHLRYSLCVRVSSGVRERDREGRGTDSSAPCIAEVGNILFNCR